MARFGLTYLIHPAIDLPCANTAGFLLGSESSVADLDRAYVGAATFVEGRLRRTCRSP